LWSSVGRPRSGSLNAERLKCKYAYKQGIKDICNGAHGASNVLREFSEFYSKVMQPNTVNVEAKMNNVTEMST